MATPGGGSGSRPSPQIPTILQPTHQQLPRFNKIKQGPRYHDPDPIIRLIRKANEAKVLIDDISITALIDTWAQVSSISTELCEKIGLEFGL